MTSSTQYFPDRLFSDLPDKVPKSHLNSCDCMSSYSMIPSIIRSTGTHLKNEIIKIERIFPHQDGFTYIQHDILCAKTVLVVMTFSYPEQSRVGTYLYQRTNAHT